MDPWHKLCPSAGAFTLLQNTGERHKSTNLTCWACSVGGDCGKEEGASGVVGVGNEPDKGRRPRGGRGGGSMVAAHRAGSVEESERG